MPVIRYPGSKDKLYRQFTQFIPERVQCALWSLSAGDVEYREPFFRAGAIGWRLLNDLAPHARIWLNDLDRDVMALWRSVWKNPCELQTLVHRFNPTAEAFYEFKERDGRDDDAETVRGFRKLALHRMSYSGLGCKSGGPLGGKDQENARYRVDCRWNPERICKDIRALSVRLRAFSHVQMTVGDFQAVIEDAPRSAFIYCDPPYVVKGPDLYRHSMSDNDHNRLAGCLRWCESSWMLSYDDCDLVRGLYSWANIHEVELTYTVGLNRDAKRPKNKEVVVVPKA